MLRAAWRCFDTKRPPFRAADIDLDAPDNASPAQCAEDAGAIEVLRVPLSGLHAALAAHSAAGGVVFSGLWTLAMGLGAAHES